MQTTPRNPTPSSIFRQFDQLVDFTDKLWRAGGCCWPKSRAQISALGALCINDSTKTPKELNQAHRASPVHHTCPCGRLQLPSPRKPARANHSVRVLVLHPDTERDSFPGRDQTHHGQLLRARLNQDGPPGAGGRRRMVESWLLQPGRLQHIVLSQEEQEVCKPDDAILGKF